jgi:hypothetical protein
VVTIGIGAIEVGSFVWFKNQQLGRVCAILPPRVEVQCMLTLVEIRALFELGLKLGDALAGRQVLLLL